MAAVIAGALNVIGIGIATAVESRHHGCLDDNEAGEAPLLAEPQAAGCRRAERNG